MSVRIIHETELDGTPVRIHARTSSIVDPTTFVPMQSVGEIWYEVPAPDWPKVRIRARRPWRRFLDRFGPPRDLLLDDPEFNRVFRVDAEDADFATVLLHPPMQAFLLEKRTVDWSLGRGALKLFYRGNFRRGRMPASLDRLRRFRTLIPVELDEWREAPAVTPPRP